LGVIVGDIEGIALYRHLYFPFQQLTQNITDVLNKGIKPSCRWWSSFDLYRRLWFTFIILVFHYAEPSLTPVSDAAEMLMDSIKTEN